MQCSTVQYSTVYSSVQFSTVQYIIIASAWHLQVALPLFRRRVRLQRPLPHVATLCLGPELERGWCVSCFRGSCVCFRGMSRGMCRDFGRVYSAGGRTWSARPSQCRADLNLGPPDRVWEGGFRLFSEYFLELWFGVRSHLERAAFSMSRSLNLASRSGIEFMPWSIMIESASSPGILGSAFFEFG